MPPDPEHEELYRILGEVLGADTSEKISEAEERLRKFPVFGKGIIKGLIDILCDERKKDEHAYCDYVYPFGIRQRAGRLLVLEIGKQVEKLAKLPDRKIMIDSGALSLAILSAFSKKQETEKV